MSIEKPQFRDQILNDINKLEVETELKLSADSNSEYGAQILSLVWL